MSSCVLAPSDSIAGQSCKRTDDPFANPASAFPESSKPCTYLLSSPAQWRNATAEPSMNTGHNDPLQSLGIPAYKLASISSSSSGSTVTPLSSLDLEKACRMKEQERQRLSGQPDPEKHMDHDPISADRPILPTDSASVAFSEAHDVDESRQLQEQKALNILLFLSGPCVLLSSLNAGWACIALVITILTQPIRLCARRLSFGLQLAGLLGPTLNLQLRYIYTPLPPHANEDGSYHTAMLTLVHMLSPFLSLGMMLVAWVVAVFWVSSMVVGDPSGTDKRDDGRETVLGLRRWWECWLLKGVKEL